MKTRKEISRKQLMIKLAESHLESVDIYYKIYYKNDRPKLKKIATRKIRRDLNDNLYFIFNNSEYKIKNCLKL